MKNITDWRGSKFEAKKAKRVNIRKRRKEPELPPPPYNSDSNEPVSKRKVDDFEDFYANIKVEVEEKLKLGKDKHYQNLSKQSTSIEIDMSSKDKILSKIRDLEIKLFTRKKLEHYLIISGLLLCDLKRIYTTKHDDCLLLDDAIDNKDDLVLCRRCSRIVLPS